MKLIIITQNGVVVPKVLEGANWVTKRRGEAGKFTFKYLADNFLVQEGDIVKVTYKDKKVFYGFIFSMSRDRNKIISVVAYDQLKYLKNKDVYRYENKKASEVIKMLAEDFQLKLGEIEDTGYVISKRIEDNVSLFDIILKALDITLQNSKKMYVLYDDFGKLALKDVEKMMLDVLIDDTQSENFKYKSSIENSANQVKVAHANKDGKRELYIAKDSNNINKWGVLQHYTDLGEKENGIQKADALLKLLNRRFKTLKIKKVFGDVRVRAGTSVIVKLNLGDTQVQNYMLVEEVKHIFNYQEHTMNLTLRGADIQ